MIKTVCTELAPEALGPYSQGKVFQDLVFTAGQIPVDPATGKIVADDISTQAAQVMENLKAILEEAGSSLDHIIKTTCFLSDMENLAQFNEVYRKYITTNPARTCVAVKQLPFGVLCEVEAIACLK